MKSLLIVIFLISLSSGEPISWTRNHSDIIEQTTLALTPKLRQQTVIIGRLGLAETYVGTIIDQEGHLIAPYLPSPDGEPLPYLLYEPDGRRRELKIIEEKPERFLALLKCEMGFPGAPPIQVSSLDQHTVVIASCAPIASKDEEISLTVDHLAFAPAEQSNTFQLELPIHFPGSSVFDISGHLIGFILASEQSTTKALSLRKATLEFPSLGKLLPEETPPDQPELPVAPSLTREEQRELYLGEIIEARFTSAIQSLPSPLPCVLIFNEGSPLTNSIIGTIIQPNGLILTKASELGPSLNVRYSGRNYPAILLATDERTDLALISIEAEDLPTISWDETPPTPGATMFSPILLKENSEDMLAQQRAYYGTFSHLLRENSPTLHSSSRTTSLGLYTEQSDSSLTIAALIKGSPAYDSGLTPGDLLLEIDSKEISSRDALTTILSEKKVGDEVTVSIRRGERPMDFLIQLSAPTLKPPATGMNNATGLSMIPSVWRGPFPDAYVHTTPLNAWDCGSPLFNRQGQALGINIAAVSPGRSYTLVPKEIKQAVSRMLSQSRPF